MGWGAASPRVLLVGDDDDVCESLNRGLHLSGFEVDWVRGSAAGWRGEGLSSPDVVVLDIGIPSTQSLQALHVVRVLDSQVPVCVLAAPRVVDDRVAGLEAGADDYLVKPFALGNLVTRLRALLRSRRGDGASLPSVVVGPVRIDHGTRRVLLNEVAVPLSPREYELLTVLAGQPGALFSRTELLRTVWGYDTIPDTDVVDLFIGYLRRKLEVGAAPRIIHTVSGAGFTVKAP